MKKIIIILTVILITSANLYSQQIIFLNNGNFCSRIILGETGNFLIVKSLDGKISTINKSDIKRMTPDKATIITDMEIKYTGTITDVNDSIIKFVPDEGAEIIMPRKNITGIELLSDFGRKSTPFGGFTVISTGGVNLLFGGYFSRFGIRGELNIYSLPSNFFSGFQVNLLYRIYNSKHFESNISLGIGLNWAGQINPISFYPFYDNNNYYNNNGASALSFLGVFGDVNIYGIFVEIGWAGSEGFRNGWGLLGQVGYVVRFGD
ncbi:MAG: hypothetical protein ABSG15_01685 [FCB group bacterium]|jgi:hypothetical protein